MRVLGLAIVGALAVFAVTLPAPTEAVPDAAVAVAEPAVAVCPIQEGSGRSTEVAVLSTVDGPTRLTLFTGGGSAGTLGTVTGASGSTVIPVGDVAAVGTVGGLVELPNQTSTAGVRITGSESHMAESCQSVPFVQTYITGGSTLGEEDTFSIQLMNPYAGEAIATLEVVSEGGVESNDRFSSVVVPPRSSTTLDLTALVPGREHLSVSVETVLGRVITVGRQGVEGEAAVWSSVSPAQDWFVPFPTGGAAKTLVIGTPSPVAVDYQIDFYGPDGLEEAFETGTVEARGRVEVDLAAISQEAAGVRVISTGPIVSTLRTRSESAFTTTVGATTQASRWMLPGAGAPVGGSATVVIMNAGLDDSTVSIRPLRADSVLRRLDVPADDVIEIGLEPADGYLVEATSPVVVMWVSRAEVGVASAIGVPLDDE